MVIYMRFCTVHTIIMHFILNYHSAAGRTICMYVNCDLMQTLYEHYTCTAFRIFRIRVVKMRTACDHGMIYSVWVGGGEKRLDDDIIKGLVVLSHSDFRVKNDQRELCERRCHLQSSKGRTERNENVTVA